MKKIRILMWIFRFLIFYSLVLTLVHYHEFCVYYIESKEYHYFIKNIRYCPHVLEVDISELKEWSGLLRLADEFDRNSTLNTDEIFVLLWIYVYAHGKKIELPVTPEWEEPFEGIVKTPWTKYISYDIPCIFFILCWFIVEAIYRKILEEKEGDEWNEWEWDEE